MTLREALSVIASVLIVAALTHEVARTSSRVAAIEAQTALLKARVAMDVRELPGGWVALVAVGFDGAEQVISVGRREDFIPVAEQ